MLAGHYSTALIASQKSPKGTLIYFLIACQLQDLLWFILHYLGLERTEPTDVFDTTLSNMTVDMLYSHDLLPLIFWIILIFIIGKLAFKSTKIGLIGAALVAGHFILDFFSGHPHHLFGDGTLDAGLGLYATNIYLAIAIEAVFILVTLLYFFRQDSKNGIERTTKNKVAIIGLFVFGILFMITIATNSFREIFGIPSFDFGFNSSIPTLIMTYVGMILYLNYFLKQYKTVPK